MTTKEVESPWETPSPFEESHTGTARVKLHEVSYGLSRTPQCVLRICSYLVVSNRLDRNRQVATKVAQTESEIGRRSPLEQEVSSLADVQNVKSRER